jgi:integrase
VREDNPAHGVAGPDRGGKKALQYLWPSEFLTFVSSPLVPMEWRRLAALSTYFYCRPEELEVLEWPDIDLDHATVHIHRAIDRVRNVGVVWPLVQAPVHSRG